MKKINAKIVADSVNSNGDRITTYLLTYPRIIHGELMTHRMFSRNSASSRAIPFERMVKMIEEDPFIPIAWQKAHSGMQGTEYITDEFKINKLRESWIFQSRRNLRWCNTLYDGVTKQLKNRLLEPFMWHTTLVTATEYDNFFELRCPKYEDDHENIYYSKKDYLKEGSCDCKPEEWTDIQWLTSSGSSAEIHIQALAEAMWDTRNESKPKELEAGEWHIPFGDKMDEGKLFDLISNNETIFDRRKERPLVERAKIQVATARCARLSYMTFDGEIDYEKDIALHDRLLEDGHMSPFEHCARAMSNTEAKTFIKGKCEVNPISEEVIAPVLNEGWCDNFKGFIPYRYLVENK